MLFTLPINHRSHDTLKTTKIHGKKHHVHSNYLFSALQLNYRSVAEVFAGGSVSSWAETRSSTHPMSMSFPHPCHPNELRFYVLISLFLCFLCLVTGFCILRYETPNSFIIFVQWGESCRSPNTIQFALCVNINTLIKFLYSLFTPSTARKVFFNSVGRCVLVQLVCLDSLDINELIPGFSSAQSPIGFSLFYLSD